MNQQSKNPEPTAEAVERRAHEIYLFERCPDDREEEHRQQAKRALSVQQHRLPHQ